MSSDLIDDVQAAMNQTIAQAIGVMVSGREAGEFITALEDRGVILTVEADALEGSLDTQVTIDVSDRIYSLLSQLTPRGCQNLAT